MLGWTDVWVRLERNRDLLREAERYRLVREALAGRPGGPRLHCLIINWLGGRMVAWGRGLQERYGAATPSALRVTDCTQCSR